jgi:hypothetical protein
MNTYDRTVEDVGNVVALEHVNTRVPDQQLAILFYATGLGLTRDPYLMTGVGNMWMNVGRSQFHLPTGAAQVLHGHTGLVMPNRAALLTRLNAVKGALEGTRWGNRIRLFQPCARFGRMQLGMPYVEFEAGVGTADGIARFYREVMQTRASVAQDAEGRFARVSVGAGQDLYFRETAKPAPAFDGHHVAVYLGDFSGPYRRLMERGLITEESDQHQYRFQDIVALDTGKVLFTVEHEVRSMRHPLYARPQINRNPEQSNRSFAPGHEELPSSLPIDG